MNRLVLIGNGFDLAHGLRTSYENYICWYYIEWGNRLLHSSNKKESDDLCTFTLKDIGLNAWYLVWGYHYQRVNPLIPWDPTEVFFNALKDRDICDFNIDSPLMERIWKHLALGWVDIENIYYSLLTEEKMEPNKGFVKPNYKALNHQLDIIKKGLIEYLTLVCKEDKTAIDDISDKIYRPIKEREMSVSYKETLDSNQRSDKNPSAIMLLNFNYTSTPEQYVSDPSKVTINYIHGKLEDPQSVILGYGDELDTNYKKLQNLNDNEPLRHIKSIRYLESDNYRRMLEFIESGPFQICIMGHSCGNSDRTLLNTIFEHRNCISIKPYYYQKEGGKDSYIETVQNISRNFTDMKLLRDRVVNKMYCETLTGVPR